MPIPIAISLMVPKAPPPYAGGGAVGVEAAGSKLQQKGEMQEQPRPLTGGEGARQAEQELSVEEAATAQTAVA